MQQPNKANIQFVSYSNKQKIVQKQINSMQIRNVKTSWNRVKNKLLQRMKNYQAICT